METLKKMDLVAIPAFNISAVFTIGTFPTLDVIESVFKIAVLAATLIFTIVRTFQILKSKKNKKSEE